MHKHLRYYLYCVFAAIVFRYQPSFHGVDLSGLREAAVQEYFKQPVVVSNARIIIISVCS